MPHDHPTQQSPLTCPTLVTVGRADWVTPVASAETIAGLLPNAELVVFENSGHSPQVEEAELFQQTMRAFLAEALPERLVQLSPVLRGYVQ